ncbi:MAG: TIGR02679 family protein [Tepidanaerobacteraceae bacterium]|jgi:uncharacterized protein (TIGR02679 family)|nr:TIGR02679 family protein [Tepidanaerobacteraceae bacterium]
MKQEDLNFFKDNRGYRRLFEAFRKKYKSLGRIGGSIQLSNLSREEKEVLTNHFRKDFTRQSSACVSLLKFEESLKSTRFECYSLKEILEAYFGEPLTGKKEDQEAFRVQRDRFFERLFSVCRSEESRTWLGSVYEGKAAGARAVETRLSKEDDRKRLFREMEDVLRALDDLPVKRKKKERLAVFASRITQNPHAFDIGTAVGNLFFNALLTVMDAEKAKDSRDRVEVYYAAGILMDEISNYVTVAGLRAFRGDIADPVWQAAYENGEVLQVPLLNLSSIDRVTSPTGKVFAVENPGIFSSLIDTGRSGKSPQRPLICTFGQPRLSAFVLLDLLAESGMQIYYSGDFDPEGILIADRLFRRYKANLKLWHYSVGDYNKCLSQKTISEKRLSMLKNLACPELAPVARHMLEVKRAGYQELLIDDLAADVSQ